MSENKLQGTRDLIMTLIYAGLIAMAVRTFAYEPFNIPSGSMVPTLLEGDYLFVSKFSYGYSRYSLPFNPPILSGRVFDGGLERGDVAVFKLPSDTSKDYIKRIVGLPGDRIQVTGGILHINGEPVKRERAEDFIIKDRFGNVRRIPRFEETLPNGRRHMILEFSDNSPFDDTREYVVPEDHVFAMGDNRDRSRDSRFLGDVGFVPRENLVGRAEFIFFSVDGDIWKIWEWFRTVRGSRLLQGIE